jgi:hypothetical protein
VLFSLMRATCLAHVVPLYSTFTSRHVICPVPRGSFKVPIYTHTWVSCNVLNPRMQDMTLTRRLKLIRTPWAISRLNSLEMTDVSGIWLWEQRWCLKRLSFLTICYVW